MSRGSWPLRIRIGCGLHRGMTTVLLLALLSSAWALSPAGSKKPVHIFFVDVEGGQATLFVTPDQHSLLIDTGWPGNNGRDADRIVSMAKRRESAKSMTSSLPTFTKITSADCPNWLLGFRS